MMSRVELVVDAANVVGSRPDGWWRDRPGAAARLVSALAAALRSGALTSPVVVILEGAARSGVPATPTEDRLADSGGGAARDGTARDGTACDGTGGGAGGEVGPGAISVDGAIGADDGPVSGRGMGEGGAIGEIPTLRVLHAPADGDSAIVAEVIALVDSGAEVTVVTADRALRARVVAAGGDVVGPSWLRDRLP